MKCIKSQAHQHPKHPPLEQHALLEVELEVLNWMMPQHCRPPSHRMLAHLLQFESANTSNFHKLHARSPLVAVRLLGALLQWRQPTAGLC